MVKLVIVIANGRLPHNEHQPVKHWFNFIIQTENLTDSQQHAHNGGETSCRYFLLKYVRFFKWVQSHSRASRVVCAKSTYDCFCSGMVGFVCFSRTVELQAIQINIIRTRSTLSYTHIYTGTETKLNIHIYISIAFQNS